MMIVVAFIFSSNCPLFRIASNPYSSGWNNFARNLGQRSEVLNLTEGEDYLLVGELKEAGGGDYMQVSPLSVCLSVCLAGWLAGWLSMYCLGNGICNSSDRHTPSALVAGWCVDARGDIVHVCTDAESEQRETAVAAYH